ncbi:Transposon-encoded protein TnpW [[Eubacterium] yurii]|nr:Transposon-encoded protein TnpW [[Eubacterium] yurii]
MQEKRNEQTTGTKTIKKIGKVTYEVVVHFNENATETMQDKLTRIMLRELRRKSDEKKDDFD